MPDETAVIKCIVSLTQATQDVVHYDINAMLKMKVQDFIILIAVPHNIQFKVMKPRVRKGPLK